MKQNERLLVYAVTGFLALILVIAVLFGNPADAAGKKLEGSQELSDILGQKGGPGSGPGDSNSGDSNSGDSNSGDAKGNSSKGNGVPSVAGTQPVSIEHPLIAKPQVARNLVARMLGASRRDRNVRFVRAKRGDAFETLVRRWCGKVNPYLDEAVCLNEDTTMLREGQEVAVPWVEDEVLAALIELQAPRTLTSQGGAMNAGTAPMAGTPRPSASGPSFAMPGVGSPKALGDRSGRSSGASNGALAAVTTYTVKKGDSLWKIAAKRYGKRHADRMIKEIRQLNPGLTDNLSIKQKLKLPAKSE